MISVEIDINLFDDDYDMDVTDEVDIAEVVTELKGSDSSFEVDDVTNDVRPL